MLRNTELTFVRKHVIRLFVHSQDLAGGRCVEKAMLCPAENAAMNSGVKKKKKNFCVSARKVLLQDCEMFSADKVMKDEP